MAEHVFFFDGLPEDAAEIAGGKGASLSRMTRAGFPVPPGFVISAQAFGEFLTETGGLEAIERLLRTLDVDDARAVDAASGHIRRLIVDAPLPALLSTEIMEAHASLGNGELVAVRSSAVCEDGTTASFAGQQETFLGVRGVEQVLGRIQECWASFFSPRALFYRSRKSVLSDTRMAVVVQEMVNADTSGVMFTVDPIRGRRHCMVIEAAHGLGEAVVSGEGTPDHYVVSRTDGSLLDEFIADDDKGRVLQAQHLARLQTLGLTLEAFFGSPQDVEWCLRGDDLLLLQSRPITTLTAHA